ncbi:MAG: flagellar basal body P-ring protein FlgI [Pirellulales bacterium]
MLRNVVVCMLIKNVARLKGQEEITIQGLGLVVGLNGTGDGPAYAPTLRGLAAMLTKMNSPIATDGLRDLKDAKNVALVMVTTTIPASGARQGDKLECTVSSVGACKSLDNGFLVTTAMLSPQVGNDRITVSLKGLCSWTIPRPRPWPASARAVAWKKISSTTSSKTARSRSS